MTCKRCGKDITGIKFHTCNVKAKCHYDKDGKFHACEEFDPTTTLIHKREHRNELFLSCCSTVLRPPQPKEPIIKQSGETLVARYKGTDYLCINPREHNLLVLNLEDGEELADIIAMFAYVWQPITEIELTDKIAKLRPMVVWGMFQKNRDILVRIRADGGHVLDHTVLSKSTIIRPATIDDLD